MVELADLPAKYEEWLPDAVGIGVGLFGTPVAIGALDAGVNQYMGGNVWGKGVARVGIIVLDGFLMAQNYYKHGEYQSPVFYGALTSLVIVSVDTAIFLYNQLGGAALSSAVVTAVQPGATAQVRSTTQATRGMIQGV